MALKKDQLQTLLRKNPVSTGCALLCIALGVYSYVRLDAIPTAENDLQVSVSLVDRLSNNIANAKQLKDQLEALESASAKMQSRLIKASALADNQRYFYRLESSTGVKLIDLRQTATNPDELPSLKLSKDSPYQRVGFTVVLQGEYPKLMGFLREVESAGVFCRINSFTLAPAVSAQQDATAGASLLTMSLNLDLVGTL